jgi:hypothetical protein
LKKKFRSLELAIKKLLNSYESGCHTSSLKDSLIDVDITRQYQPGDKKLDSRSSLRASETMSRVFTPERALTVFLILDVSASQHSKLEQAVATCLYMSYLADLGNDKIGLVTFSDKVHRHVQPSNDQRAIMPVLEKIYEDNQLGGMTDLEKVLLYLGGLNLTNTLLVLISDFCYPLTDRSVVLAKRAVSGANNTMIAPVLINQDEWHLDDYYFTVNFKDAEIDKSASWNFSSSKSNKAHNKIYEKWQSELKIRLRQAKIEPIMMSVNRSDYLLPLVKYFVRG